MHAAVPAEHADRPAAQCVQRRVPRQERGQAVAVEQRERGQQVREQHCRQRAARRRMPQHAGQVAPGLVDGRGLRCRHAHVEAQADHRARRAGGLAAAFHQQPAELAAVHDDVVRPFHADALRAQRLQRLADGHAGGQAQPAQACQPAAVAARQREVEIGGQRRGPGAATPPATGGLALGQQDRCPSCRRLAAQQFGIGRIQRPGDFQRREFGDGGRGQRGADVAGLEQVQRLRQRIATAG